MPDDRYAGDRPYSAWTCECVRRHDYVLFTTELLNVISLAKYDEALIFLTQVFEATHGLQQ